jgi:uncharacterized protein (TIGR03503 family)
MVSVAEILNLKGKGFFKIPLSILITAISVLLSNYSYADAPLDSVLLIDSSGSMRLTDPQKLRLEGARLFIDSLQDGDRISLLDFAESGREIRGLTENSARDAVKIDLIKVGDSGEYTDLLLGLKKARELLVSGGRAEAQKSIVLISDGKMDPKPEIASAKIQTDRLFAEEIPALKSQGIKVFTIAFSQLADQRLLADIATMTGGEHRFSKDATGLKDAFIGLARAVDLATKKEVTPVVAEKSQVNIVRAFKLSEGLEQAIFYINRGDSSGLDISGPGTQSFNYFSHSSNITWYRDGQFDFVTVAKPKGGEWYISGLESKDNFATVLSNLKLGLEYSSEEVSVGEVLRVEAKFFESRKPINLPALFRTLKYSFQVVPMDKISEPVLRGNLHDDGKDGDVRAADGTFATEFAINEAGIYRVILQVEGPNLSRENVANFKVTPRLLKIKLMENSVAPLKSKDKFEEGSEGVTREELEDAFKITLSPLGQSVRERLVKLRVTNSVGATYNIAIPGNKNAKSEFLIPVSTLPASGKYEVQAQLGGTLKGRMVSARSNSIDYNYKAKEIVIESPEVIARRKAEARSKIIVNTVISPAIVTLFNVLCGLFALSIVKKHLATIVVEEEKFAMPDGAIRLLDELEKRYSTTDVDLNDPSLAPDKLAKVLEKAALTEAELLKAANQSYDDSGSALAASPEAESGAEIATAGPITEAQAQQPVESELDEETKKLLAEVEGQVDQMKG